MHIRLGVRYRKALSRPTLSAAAAVITIFMGILFYSRNPVLITPFVIASAAKALLLVGFCLPPESKVVRPGEKFSAAIWESEM